MSALRTLLEDLTASTADLETLSGCRYDAKDQANDHFDYSKVVVRKPWGYEYLIFENDDVAVWILHLKQGEATSFHCHVNKTTSLCVLSGTVVSSTFSGDVVREPGQGRLIGKKVFHRTAAVSAGGAWVMEIESPVNKRDLVRFRDSYGRQGQGYEGPEHFTVNVSNYNYISFVASTAYYDTSKSFGDCTLRLIRSSNPSRLGDLEGVGSASLLGILSGTLNQRGHCHGAGAMIEAGEALADADCSADFAALIVSRSDRRVRASDFLVSRLKARGLAHYYFAPGTSNAHLVDAIAREPDALYIAQATDLGAAQAAVVHAKLTGQPTCCVLSTGAAASSALTAAADAWTDSAPVLFLSAQSLATFLQGEQNENCRQAANKHLPISDLARPISKWSTRVDDHRKFSATIEIAMREAVSGRPGPVWIDIPIDLLGRSIDPTEQEAAPLESPAVPDRTKAAVALSKLVERLAQSARPVILVGHGVRQSGAFDEVLSFASAHQIPLLFTRRGADLADRSHPVIFGRPGAYGHRAANFLLQNADLLLSVGTRLSLALTGRNTTAFARNAFKARIDIDAQELARSTPACDLPIHTDARRAFVDLASLCTKRRFPNWSRWLEKGRHWIERYPQRGRPNAKSSAGIDPYEAISDLSEQLPEQAILIAEGGSCLDFVMQSLRLKAGQRVLSSSGLEAEGFSIPGAIGAYLGSCGKSRIVCFCSASSFLASLHELSPVLSRELPVTLFVLSSNGDAHTTTMQAAYFGGRIVHHPSQQKNAESAARMLSQQYEVPYLATSDAEEFRVQAASLLSGTRPSLCILRTPEDLVIGPRILHSVTDDGRWNSRPLEDMFPLLDREELAQQMDTSKLSLASS